MEPIVTVAVVTAVLATVAVVWWRRWTRVGDRTAATAAQDATHTGSGGPSDGLDAGPRRRNRHHSDGFDPDGLPLSRDFLPERGDPPPVEQDVFAELARRRMRDTDS